MSGKSSIDWPAVQKFYDEGNSFRDITRVMGIHNFSITRAVKRGDLISRKRGYRNDVLCEGCDFIFKRRANKRFCSQECHIEHSWLLTHLPRVMAGTAGAKAIKRYLRTLSDCCAICNLSEWMGKPIALHLDHIDGNCENNSLSNVRLLCPNCHSQTDTFSGKNIGRFVTKRSILGKRRRRPKRMVRPPGIEPGAPTTSRSCSTAEL